MDYRTEKDSLGSMKVPARALYGIHALRARENFPAEVPFSTEWYRAMGTVKLACYQTYEQFRHAALEYQGDSLPLAFFSQEVIHALQQAATEIAKGQHRQHFIPGAVQGGAGTSINMTVNEIIANRALQAVGSTPGNYSLIDPVEQANIYQSTNDVVPTALTVAVLRLLTALEEAVNELRYELEALERKHRHDLRPGYTQMQEAVPSSFGMLFAAYNEALSRDWWRVSKGFERIKGVNLGGGAIGTGMSIPRFFIMEVVPVLQRLTSLPVTRSENLPDATANLDSWVEVHATLKAHAVNLEKMASDLRLLASDLGDQTVRLPKKQVGSSIMPGKVNPVIPEYVVAATHRIYANDQLISSLSARGCLDLNAYLPSVGHAMIDSLKLLLSLNYSIKNHMICGLEVRTGEALEKLYRSPSITTALSPHIGYHKAGELASLMQQKGVDIFAANAQLGFFPPGRLQRLLQPDQLLKLGFRLQDLGENSE